MAIKKKRPRIRRLTTVIVQVDEDGEPNALREYEDPCGYVEDDIEEVPIERPIKPNNIK